MAHAMKMKGTKPTVNKSAFVRAQPSSMTANDVVAKAKAQGITMKAGLVYVIRSQAKARAGKTGKKRGRPAKAASTMTAMSASSGVENLLRAAAAEIGLSRSLAMLTEQREAVRKVLGG